VAVSADPRPRSALALASAIVNGGAASVLLLLVLAASLFSPLGFAFGAWAASPFLLLFLVPLRLAMRGAAAAIPLAAGGAGAVAYGWVIQRLVAEPDAQAGLVVLFLPVYALPVAGVALAVAVALHRRARRGSVA
jgi:hypothetical protein